MTARQTAGFRGVPEAVWNFYIGGYQVCEKWLKVGGAEILPPPLRLACSRRLCYTLPRFTSLSTEHKSRC